MLRLKKTGASDQGWAEIATVVDTTNITIDIKADFGDSVATTDWRLGAFGSDTGIGFPAVLAFHEQRLWFGANPGAAQTVYGSVISLFETFSPTQLSDSVVLDDSGIVYTIAADKANPIEWMDATRTLILGTKGGICYSWNEAQYEDDRGPAWGLTCYEDGFAGEVDYMVNRCILNGEAPLSTLDDAMDALKVIQTAERVVEKQSGSAKIKY